MQDEPLIDSSCELDKRTDENISNYNYPWIASTLPKKCLEKQIVICIKLNFLKITTMECKVAIYTYNIVK